VARRRLLLDWGIAALAVFCLAGPQAAFGGTRRIAIRAGGGYRGGYARVVSYGGYGGFYSPGYFGSYLPPAGSYLPPYWWTGQNSGTDPRQAGYNPSGGYSWDSVGALLLSTTPADARVTLDGTDIGTANYLGPIQLPMGKHTIKIEAPGYETSETTLDIQKPAVQKINILLGRAKQASALSPGR
jgi:PEGA domain